MIALLDEDPAVLRVVQAAVAIGKSVVAVVKSLDSGIDCGVSRLGIVLERDKRPCGIPELDHGAGAVHGTAPRGLKAFHGIAVAIPDRAAVAQRELVERRVGGDFWRPRGLRTYPAYLKCMGRSADRLICQSLPAPSAIPAASSPLDSEYPGPYAVISEPLVSHGDGWIGCKFRVYAEAVRVHRCVNPKPVRCRAKSPAARQVSSG